MWGVHWSLMPNDCASRSVDLVLSLTTLIDSLSPSLDNMILFWTEFHNFDALKRNVLDFSGRIMALLASLLDVAILEKRE